MGVDEVGVDEVGVDEMGSRRIGTTPLKCISKQKLIKIYHAVKSYEHCHYLTTTS